MADKIVRDLLQKDSLEQVKQAQLEDLVKDYPYFSLARYLLAAKAAGTGSPNADRIISASALYFNNPLWFSQILNMNGSTVEPAESSANDTENYPAQETTTDPSAVQAEPVLNSTGEIPADEPEPVTSGEIGDFTDDTTGIVEANVPDPAIRSALEAVKTEASRETSETDLIQPYHAIDYFASQGIKLAQDKEPQDKFGKQLKSFTEWLKTMKKIPVPNPEDF
ncbi:MAG TPA: hypothetical protein VIK74_02880, partial [Parasegetibacter sp.]